MRRFISALLLYAVFAVAQQALSKDDIVRMVQQGIPPATIAETIRTAPRIGFSATDQDRAQLEKQGVPKMVTSAMLERTQQGVDLPPFEKPKGERRAKKAPPTTASQGPLEAPASGGAPVSIGTTEYRTPIALAASGQPRIYISPMQGNLDGFIAAEIIKQRIPVLVVTDEHDAQFVLTGLSLQEDDKWYHIAFGTFKDRNEGNVRLLNVQSKTMVWAGEAGDRSLIYGGFKRGGQRKIAQRIAEHMKKEYFNEAK